MPKDHLQDKFDGFADEQNALAPSNLALRGLGVAPKNGSFLSVDQVLDEVVGDIEASLALRVEELYGAQTAPNVNIIEVLRADIRELLRPMVRNDRKEVISMLDVVTLGLTDPPDIKRFLMQHGIDLDCKDDLLYASKVLKDAIAFYDTVIAKGATPKLHPSLKKTNSIDGICRIFQTAAGKHQRHSVPEACALLRIAACIDFLNKDPLLTILPEAERQLKEIHDRHFVNRKGKTFFESRRHGDIPMEIIRAELRTKTKDRMIAKLLHKPRNSTQEVVDHIGMRVTTKSAFDALRFLYLAFFKPDTAIFPGINIRTDESHQLLLDENALMEALGSPRKAAELIKQLATPTIDHSGLITIGGEMNSDNPFSGGGYKAIKVTFDLPLKMPNGQRVHFPLEVQIVDRGSRLKNDTVAPHQNYVERQTAAVVDRILGRNLWTAFKGSNSPQNHKSPV